MKDGCQFLGIASDADVHRVGLLSVVPECDLGHARLFGPDLHLIRRQGREHEDFRVLHSGLGDLLLDGQDPTRVDGHLQAIRLADAMYDRRGLAARSGS